MLSIASEAKMIHLGILVRQDIREVPLGFGAEVDERMPLSE